MAFDYITTNRGYGHAPGKPSLSGVVHVLSNSTASKSYAVMIATDVLARIGLAPGDYASVMVGSGDDFGRIAIMPGAKGTRGARKLFLQGKGKTPALSVAFSALPPARGKFSSTRVPHSITGGMLVIDMRPVLDMRSVLGSAA